MKFHLYSFIFLLLLSVSCDAQLLLSGQGYVPYGSYQANDIESVNLSSLNVLLDLPFASYKQKGSLPDFSLRLVYNTPIWGQFSDDIYCDESGQGYPIYCDVPSWQPVITSNNTAGGPAIQVVPSNVYYPLQSVFYESDPSGDGGTVIGSIQELVVDGSGATHYGPWQDYSVAASSSGFPETQDAIGMRIGGNPGAQNFNVITDKYGITYSSGLYPYVTERDPDGNQITPVIDGTSTETGWTDSIGRYIPNPVQTNGCTSYSYPGINGTASSAISGIGGGGTTTQVTLCYSTHVISASMLAGCNPNVGASFSQNILQLDSLTLPNGKQYTFQYDSLGEIVNITLPTGGSTSYQYNYTNGYFCQGAGAPLQQRTEYDSNGTLIGQWQYRYAPSGATIVTDPNNNDTAHYFGAQAPLAGPNNPYDWEDNYESETDYYAGSYTAPTLGGTCPALPSAPNILKTVLTDYLNTGQQFPVGVGYAVPVRVRTILQGGSMSQTIYQYDGLQPLTSPDLNYTNVQFGSRTQEQDYDFGNCTPGALLRTINTGFEWQGSGTQNQNYLNSNLVAFPSSVQTLDSSGSKVAETNYSYDQTGYVSAAGPLGHVTTISNWLNTGSTSPTMYTYYDGSGMPTTAVDANGNHTSTTYQCSDSLPYQVTNPLGQTTTYGYDCNTSLMGSVQDANLHTTTYNYTPVRDLQSVSYPDGGSISTNYNGYAVPLTVTTTQDAAPNPSIVTTVVYDGIGRPVTTTNPDGSTSETSYDGLGNVSYVTNPHSSTPSSTDGTTSYQYDALNRKRMLCRPDNGTGNACSTGSSYQQWSYTGNTVSFTDENGNQTQFTYDASARLAQVLNELFNPQSNLTTNYTYDALNNLIGVNQLGTSTETPRVRSFTYDSLSRLQQAYNPESGWTCYGTTSDGGPATQGNCNFSNSYDANGNLLHKTDARGAVVNYHYDALNRLTGKDYTYSIGSGGQAQNVADPTPSVSYTYDTTSLPNSSNTIGRLTDEKVTDTDGVTTLYERQIPSYNEMGEVLTDSRCHLGICPNTYLPVNYTYDLAGNVTSSTIGYLTLSSDAPMTVSYTYDSAGRMLSEVAADPTVTLRVLDDAQYSPSGLFAGQAGTFNTQQYDSRERTKSISYDFSSAGLTPYTANYNYYPNGNVQNVADSVNGNWSYQYDSLNRLSSATSDTLGVSTYTYDSFGNRTSQSGTLSYASTFNNPNNQADCTPTCYDAAGNLKQDINLFQTNGYGYDAEGRLDQVAPAGYRYIYDGEGQRVVEEQGGNLTRIYLREANNQFYTMADATGITFEMFGAGRHLGTVDSNAVFLPAVDALGTERARLGIVSNFSALSLETCTSLPFGDGQNCTGYDSSKLHFTGKERDTESGLDYFGARYMSSSMGRFMSPDPINLTEERLLNPSNTLNKYAYAANNPLKYVDDNGKDITIFYERPSLSQFSAGHILFTAENQQTGNAAVMSFGPIREGVGDAERTLGGMSQVSSSEFGLAGATADSLRQQYASLTIQTTPEEAQQVIDWINQHGGVQALAGGYMLYDQNCTTVCRDALKMINKIAQGNNDWSPQGFWKTAFSQYAHPYWQNNFGWTGSQPGVNYGQPRGGYDSFQLLELLSKHCSNSFSDNGDGSYTVSNNCN